MTLISNNDHYEIKLDDASRLKYSESGELRIGIFCKCVKSSTGRCIIHLK